MKILINVFILFLIIFSQSCKNDNEQLDFKNDIKIINLVSYSTDSILMTFSILSTGGNPPYKYNWINPSLLDGNGPFTLSITSNPILELEVVDANNTKVKFQYEIQKDTIDALKYDYRNPFLGFYDCEVIHRWAEYSNGTYITHQNIYQDTIEVTKNSDFKMINIADRPNLTLNYRDSTFQGYHLYGAFHQDSINFYYFITPVGLVNFKYKGKKINK